MAAERPDLGINYIEFGVRDTAANRQFYGDAFGWTFQDYGPTYTAFSNAGIDGGFDADAPLTSGRTPFSLLRSCRQ